MSGQVSRLMVYTPAEIMRRQHLCASSRSILDRQKFEREFGEKQIQELGLSAENRKIYDENPHMRQVFANRKTLVRPGRELVAGDRIASPASGRTPYKRRQGTAKTVDHWGQRKLLMSEIEFLAKYARSGDVLVYAGAAPGNHTNFLSASLFPEISMVLVDPAHFAAKPTDKIEIREGFFTDEMAKEFSPRGDRVLFVSDIRSTDKSMDEKSQREAVDRDMRMQMKWQEIIRPRASMYKMRLPYTPGTTKYLDGNIHFPVWGGRTTTETRLVVENGSVETKEYDHTDYERLMFHFNTVTRTTYYEHNFQAPGICHCFDCASEMHILCEFLKRRDRIEDERVKDGRCVEAVERGTWKDRVLGLKRRAEILSDVITREISNTGRTLVLDHGRRAVWGSMASNSKRSDVHSPRAAA